MSKRKTPRVAPRSRLKWTHDSEPIKYIQHGSEIREGGLLPRVCTMRLGTWV